MDITDEQWELVRPSIPEPETLQPGPKGGRPYRDPRDVLNAVLWVLRTGAPWADLPGRYPPYQTCHRRFQQWVKSGVLEKLLRALAEDLRSRGKLDLTEAYVDGSHAGAKRGGGFNWSLQRLVKHICGRAVCQSLPRTFIEAAGYAVQVRLGEA